MNSLGFRDSSLAWLRPLQNCSGVWSFSCSSLSFPSPFIGIRPALWSEGSAHLFLLSIRLPFTGISPSKSLVHIIASWSFSEGLSQGGFLALAMDILWLGIVSVRWCLGDPFHWGSQDFQLEEILCLLFKSSKFPFLELVLVEYWTFRIKLLISLSLLFYCSYLCLFGLLSGRLSTLSSHFSIHFPNFRSLILNFQEFILIFQLFVFFSTFCFL